MAKRLFSTDKRAETILAYLRDKDENLSAYISNSVVDETLPVYSQLRVEALYLLDFITDGAKDWTGNKLIIATGEDDMQTSVKIVSASSGAILLKDEGTSSAFAPMVLDLSNLSPGRYYADINYGSESSTIAFVKL